MNTQKSGNFQEKMLKVAGKLSQNRELLALRDGIILALPMIIVGSFFMIISSFPIPGWPEFLAKTSFHGTSVAAVMGKITNGSFGILGLIAAYGIGSRYAEAWNVDGKSVGVISIASFFVLTPSVLDKNGLEGMPYGYLGSKGLFIAILVGLLSGYIFHWFIDHNIQIKLPESVPPAVAKSFSALIPGAAIISLFGLTYGILAWTGIGNIHDLLLHILSKPLGLLGDTLIGTIIAVFLNSAFWFIGIHGANIVNSVISPIWLMNTDANRVLFKAGHLDLGHGGHIITQPFIDNFVFMGGGGATLGLVLAIGILVFTKKGSKQLDLLAPLTITPGLFNINEPTMFGLPIVLNFTLLVPFLITPAVNAITTYFAMKTGFVPLCTGAVVPWTMPPIISGFLATNSFSASLLQLVNIIIDILLYMPFISAVNKQQRLQEAEG